MAELAIRYAQESDCELILSFIRQLAEYEKNVRSGNSDGSASEGMGF